MAERVAGGSLTIVGWIVGWLPGQQKGRCSRTGPDLPFSGGGGPMVALAPASWTKPAIEGLLLLR